MNDSLGVVLPTVDFGPEGDRGSEYRNAIIDSSQGGSCPEPSQFLAIVCLLKLAGFCGFFHLPTHRS